MRDTQIVIQKEMSVISSEIASIKEVIKNNSLAIDEFKSNIVSLKEKKDSIEQLLKGIKLSEGIIPELISIIQESHNTFSELNSLMTSMSGNIKSLPSIQAQIETSNTMISKIPGNYDKLITRIEKITDGMGIPEQNSWIRAAVRQGINLGVLIMILLAALGLYRVWLLIWPIFTN